MVPNALNRWMFDRCRRRARRVPVRPDTATPSGWVKDRGGYVRDLPGGAVLSVRPSAGGWYWSLLNRSGSAGRYGREFRRLSQCIAAADRAAAQAPESGSVAISPLVSP
jgi:hypothetical protein